MVNPFTNSPTYLRPADDEGDKPRDHSEYMADMRRRDGWPEMDPSRDIGRRRHFGIESAVWGIDGKAFNASLRAEHPNIYTLKRRRRGVDLVDPSLAMTRNQVVETYDALLFANRLGQTLDVCLHIAWFMLSPSGDQQSYQRSLDRFLKNFRQWLRDRLPSGDPDRRPAFVYVNENPGGERPHTHLLLAVPESLREAFREWAPAALLRIVDRTDLPPKFLRKHLPRQAGTERQWRWFHYLMKGANPDAPLDGSNKYLMDHILRFEHQNPGPLDGMNRHGIAPSLSTVQRQLFDGRDQDPWLSPLQDQMKSGRIDVRDLYTRQAYRFGCALRATLPRVHEDAEGTDDAVLKHISRKLLRLLYQAALEKRRLDEEANKSGCSVDDALRPFHL